MPEGGGGGGNEGSSSSAGPDETAPLLRAQQQSNDDDDSATIVGADGLKRRKVIHAAKETLDKASRLLRRKIPCTGHLMTPRRLWIQKVPTQECDVVMMFPSGSNEETLMWLLGRLRAGSPGLVVHVRHHASSDSYGFYLTAPFSTLLKAAEEVHLPKRLQQEYGGGLKEFVGTEAKCYEGSDDAAAFFTTQERQSLVLHLLHTLRAGPHDSLPGLKLVDGQAIIPKCLSAGIISQVFPLHELPALEKLQRSWVRAFLSPQPLDDIARYFGVKITMYFAWLGHYTTALIVPAAVGVIYWVGIIGRNQAVEDVAYVLFSIFNVIWATVYLETWKRRGAELAYRWGTLDQRDDLLVEPRPLFTGTWEISPVTGKPEQTYPSWKRNVFRYFVSGPIIAVCLFLVFLVMFVSFQIQDWWDARLEAAGYGFWLSYVPKVLLAIVIALMDEAYFKVAVWLNDLENYRLDTEYENHLICKVALFQFVNSFLSLFYIAFYIQDTERLKEQLAALLIARQVIGNLKESAVPYLIEQLRLARLSFEMFGALSPSEARQQLPGEAAAAPVNVSKDEDETVAAAAAAAAEDDKDHPRVAKQRNISQAELESSLYRVGHPTNSLLSDVAFKQVFGLRGRFVEKIFVGCRKLWSMMLFRKKIPSLQYDGAFSEHLEMLSQLGYVCLFSSAFPLAALCALMGNLLELRGDAFKLCFVLQRPFGRRVSNIGTWQNAMEAMGLVAILVNCALIGLSGQVQRMFPEMSATQTILLIVALEHIMLALRFVINCAIPDIPSWVATEMAKVEFLRREAVRRLSTTPSPSDHHASTVIGRFVVRAAAAGGGSGGGATSSSSASGTMASSSQEELRLRQQAQQELASARAAYRAMQSSQPGTPTLFSTSSSAAGTPAAAAGAAASHHQVPRITETSTPQTPGSTGSGSDHSSTFLAEAAATTTRDISNLPRGSIPGGERGRRSREWLASEQESSGSGEYSHHLTIGPSGGVDWIRRLGLESGGGRKSSDSEIISGSNSGDEMAFHRSTDCIVSKDLAGSSDSEMRYESIPPWTPNAKNQQKYRSSPEREPRSREKEKQQQSQQLTPMQQYQQHRDSVAEHREREREKEAVAHAAASAAAAAAAASTSQSTSAGGESSRRTSSQDDEKAKEEREAKKTRVKQSLMKRARSVAIFSLKLKERRAREAEIKAKEAEREARWQQQQACVGGELSCIPIEQLISVEDIAAMESMRRMNH
ncbi:anoctamin-8 isoform X3 [Trichogramma pretiosum]|uniref:anoctamin-8 isoform X3 n=1 Tax=Trichogramma pretiosum TaxID=7493 RepID=UPI0006C9D4F0|nr:anoctamin-8 isoform X3 [Trichogramma pretiosum]